MIADKKKTALISVASKDGIQEFADQLKKLGWNIVSSGGTRSCLAEAGIEATDTSTVIGRSMMAEIKTAWHQANLTYMGESESGARLTEPQWDLIEAELNLGAMLGHRVVTISRSLAAAELAFDTEEDWATLERSNIPWIELVCCDFYPLQLAVAELEGAVARLLDEAELDPFNETRIWMEQCLIDVRDENDYQFALGQLEANGGLTDQAFNTLRAKAVAYIVDKTDIGGPNMVRAAAKGGRIVICDPADRQMVLDQLAASGDVCSGTRAYLRAKAEAVVKAYVEASARFHSTGDFDGVSGRKVCELAYGENRDQSPASLFVADDDDPLGWGRFLVDAGEPSYISLADGDRALGVMCRLAEGLRRNFPDERPAIAVACKHGNPVGVGVAFDGQSIEAQKAAINKAMLGDSLAVMGCELMVNFPVIPELTGAILTVPEDQQERVGRKNWGSDVIFAPEAQSEAVEKLTAKNQRRRIMTNPALANPTMPPAKWMMRPVRGGWLQQRAPQFVLEVEEHLRDDWGVDLLIAWAVTWQAVSNTVALAKDNMLIGLGCGQQDRVACVQLCLDRANRSGHRTNSSVFASDAFFPYAEAKPGAPLEGPQLLAGAGCYGGVVPADGKNLEAVQEYFSFEDMQIVFVDKAHRGFCHH